MHTYDLIAAVRRSLTARCPAIYLIADVNVLAEDIANDVFPGLMDGSENIYPSDFAEKRLKVLEDAETELTAEIQNTEELINALRVALENNQERIQQIRGDLPDADDEGKFK